MAVTVNATATAAATTASASSLTNSNLTIGAGATALLAVLTLDGQINIPSDVTVAWNTGGTPQAMTQIAEINQLDANVICYLFGLVNPAAGNLNMTASWTDAAPAMLDAIAFNGTINSTVANAFLHAATNSGSGTPTLSVTSQAGNIVVASLAEIDAVTSLTATGSTSGRIVTDASGFGFAWSRAPGASTVAWTGAPDSGEWVIAGVDIAAASVQSGTTTETASAASTQSALATRLASVTEAATAATAQIANIVTSAARAEAAAAIDAPRTGQSYSADVTEAAVAGDTPSAGATSGVVLGALPPVIVSVPVRRELPVFGRDHGAIAWGNWLAQFVGKPNLEAFVRSLFAPINTLDTALRDMMRDRWLDTASGVQLDGIGTIVGQKRVVSHAVYLAFFGFDSQPSGRAFGIAPMRRQNQPFADAVTLDDDNYRTILRLKIALNNGHGTVEEIIAACQLIFQADRVIVENTGNASMTVSIGRVLDQSSILYADAQGFIPRAAGVGLTLIQFNPAHPFGFIEQGYFGFGDGVLASVFATP
jgi:hypothetical protein